LELKQAIELFLNFKERELSPRTVKEYESDLNYFMRVVGNKPVENIKTSDVMLFRSSMNCSPSLINRRISALNSFFNFLIDMEVIEKSPVKPSLRIKKAKQRVPEALTKEEVEKIMEVAKERGKRDYLMVKTILYCGLRISELLSLTPANIVHYKGRYVLRVIGKGNKERFIPLKSSLARELLEYSKDLSPGDRLFPLSYQGAKYIFNKIKEKSSLNLHPHKLRHTFEPINRT